MTIEDYSAAYSLWNRTEGVGLSRADTLEAIGRYLDRNPGMSFVAYDGEELAGTILAGHDGRRGYIHHLAVCESKRRQGVGKALTAHAMQALTADGIDKCHLFVYEKNEKGRAFWKRIGWYERPELVLMSFDL